MIRKQGYTGAAYNAISFSTKLFTIATHRSEPGTITRPANCRNPEDHVRTIPGRRAEFDGMRLCRTALKSWTSFTLNFASRNSYRQSAFPGLQRFLRMIAAEGESTFGLPARSTI